MNTVKKPVGCSTSRLLTAMTSAMPATSAATEPGMTQAVATETAPNTPMASCTLWGMKVRVEITPPCWGGATKVILGTVFLETSPRFINRPQARRIFSFLATSAASASSALMSS